MTSSAPATDALSLLTQDHDAIRGLFERLRETPAGDAATRRELALVICRALTLHATLEEQFLYPDAHDALEDDQVIAQSAADHLRMDALVRQAESPEASDAARDAAMASLEPLADAHMRREEGGLFIRLMYTSLDVELLGRLIAARRAELMR